MAKRKKIDEISNARNNTQVPLTPEANRMVAEWCDQSGQPKAVFLQRLLEWFAGMPGEAQQAVAGVVPMTQREVYADVMRQAIEHWEKTGMWKQNDKTPARMIGIIPADR